MPIIESVHVDDPITQGDVLQNVPLHRTLIADSEPKSVQ
jgi:hypothetical protein